VAVFGCGLDIAYPHEKERLFAKIAEHGAIITEFLPGTKPLPNNFPARNRIISGLVKGVLVVEAAKKESDDYGRICPR
jgi:DNA processing protein